MLDLGMIVYPLSTAAEKNAYLVQLCNVVRAGGMRDTVGPYLFA
jgi:hypothetical protein